MTRTRLFLRLLFKAAWVRKDRALTALISVGVVATIATAALTVYSDLENKLSREFRSFGANVVISKSRGSFTPDEILKMQDVLVQRNAELGSRTQAVPVAYAIATAPDGTRVVIGGTDTVAFRELNSWWSVRDGGHANSGALVGLRAAERLSAKGDSFVISFGDRQATIAPGIVFNSGSDDDSRIYIDMKTFTALTGVQPNTVLVRVVGRPREIQEAVKTLTAAFPSLEVKPVRQITETQAAVVGKTRSVVLACSAVVVILIMLCMSATFTSSVLERRKDFAVMKALGASNKAVNFLFACEAALLALAGAAAGFVAGSGIAYWIGKANFDAAILPQPALLFPVFLGSVLLALLASLAPLRLLQRIQPAAILRGE
ncbi:MAG TPA: FtsX-like permease family protein [Candidatus Angelobacter sp.]